MKAEGMEISCVSSSAEALEAVLKCEYYLLLMPLHIAEESDMEPLRMIRNAKKMPIMVLADRLAATEKVALFQAGINAFIERPVDFAVCTAQAASLIQLY